MKRILFYPKAEKWKLIREVNRLSRELKRPVSSRDLRIHFQKYPDLRPALLQRIGQLLIKAARPVPQPIPRIYPIGIIGNRMYYSPNQKDGWSRSFGTFNHIERLRTLLRYRMTDHVVCLLSSPYKATAKNALAGWILEAQELLNPIRKLDFPEKRQIMQSIEEAREYASNKYVKISPTRLISREMAATLIHNEYRKRREDENHQPSVARYLSRLRWPQSSLFPGSPIPVYWSSQMKVYLEYRWPKEDSDPYLEKALEVIMRYGAYKLK